MLQNRSWNRWDPKPKIDPSLKEHWDASKTPAANLKSFGLRAQPNERQLNNDISSAILPVSEPSKVDLVVDLFDVPNSENPRRHNRHPLCIEDEEYIAKCMAKHGGNYTKMFRDIKTNDLQYTEGKLRKLGSRFLLLTSEQRRVQVPAKVRHLVPADTTTDDVDS